MGAREKLNQAYVAGSLVFAAIAGAMAGSWLVFIITAAILVSMHMASGDIRPSRRR